MRSVGESKVSVYETKGDWQVCYVLRSSAFYSELPSHTGWRVISTYITIHTGTCTSGYIKYVDHKLIAPFR